MNPEKLHDILAQLLRYSFEECDWQWNHLTETEKHIIGHPDNLEELRKWTDKRFEDPT